jgi:hypothetical protein
MADVVPTVNIRRRESSSTVPSPCRNTREDTETTSESVPIPLLCCARVEHHSHRLPALADLLAKHRQ